MIRITNDNPGHEVFQNLSRKETYKTRRRIGHVTSGKGKEKMPSGEEPEGNPYSLCKEGLTGKVKTTVVENCTIFFSSKHCDL